MTFAETTPGQNVRYCGQELAVKEHVRGIGPGKHLTICTRWNPNLKRDDEMTFNSDLSCEPSHANDNQRQPVSRQPRSQKLRGDDREGRAGAPDSAGVQAQLQAQPKAQGSLSLPSASHAG